MIRRLLCSLASVAIVAPLLALSPAPPPGPILGYTQEHAAAEHAAESTFDANYERRGDEVMVATPLGAPAPLGLTVR